MRRLARRLERLEHLCLVPAKAPGKCQTEAEPNQRSDGGVRGELASGGLQGVAVGRLEALEGKTKDIGQ